MARRLSRDAFTALLAGTFFALSLAGAAHHEPWRDEYQAWLVARDAGSIPQLFRNVQYEGNPALWHLVLFAVTRFTSDPRALPLVHILISTAAIAVLTRHTALPAAAKILFAFGYAAFYEFNLISRGYALGLFLLFLFAAVYRPREPRLVLGAALLALLANTSPFGLMLSLVFAAPLFTDGTRRRRAAAAVVLVVGWALSVLQIYPEADNSFPVAYASAGMDAERLGFAISRILVAYVPIAPFEEAHWWNRSIFQAWRAAPQVVLSLALFGAFALGFLRRRAVAALYVGGTVLLVAFVYQTRMAHQRYVLHLLVLLVVCFALERRHEDDLPWPRLRRLSAAVRAWSGRLFVAVLAAGVYAGIAAYVSDWQRPFSSSGEAVRFLRAQRLEHLEIVAHTDFLVSPLAATLGRPLYYPERGGYGSFIVWNRGRRPVAAFDDVLAALLFMLDKGETRFLWIADAQPSFHEDNQVYWYEGGSDLVPGANVTLLAKIPPGIVPDEHYVVYLVERVVAADR